MKNRFSFMGQSAFSMFLALSAFGMMYSCSDDYVLDDTTPSFLGGSIYDELVARGNFKNTVRLIEDLDYKDVLAKTGSKTLFVASDEAYAKFFAGQTVFKKADGSPVRKYEDLSLAQKKRLLNNAMLNNAYVLEMMANCADGDKNLCLRQTGAASAVDSVAWWGKASLPQIASEDMSFGDFWTRRLTGDKAGLYIPEDASSPLVTHFLEGQLREKNITHEDVSFLFNLKQGDAGYWANADSENRSYVYDAQIVDQDVVCMNGYFHVLDKVLVAPSNMAEEIRNNGETNLFSRILDRFSTPYYNSRLTEDYNALAATPADSVFERRYIAQRGPYGQISAVPGKDLLVINTNFPFLTFDPAWTEFKSADSEAKEKNMGAMFVPNDKVLADYFITGAGRVLMDRYATKPNTMENLAYNLDQIPLDIIQALVNNLMKPSFNETVPSKYLTIMNDARDQMFPVSDGYANVDAYKAAFDKTILANNGVVYVMNKVLSPADYASVIAPALYCSNTQIMRSVVRADDNYIQGSTWSSAPLQKYFSTYLKAMQSRFSFFVPTDEGLGTYGYIDPATYVNRTGQLYWRWNYNSGKSPGGKRLPIDAVAYPFNVNDGQDIVNDKRKGNDYRSLYNDVLTTTYGEVKKNLLIEMVNQHIVVHANNDTEGVRSGQKIFLSREGAPVIVKNNIKGVGMQVSGGLQEQLGKEGKTYVSATPCTVTDVYDQSAEKNGYGNGMTYLLDRPMQPTTVTTYKAIEQVDGSLFRELCEGATKELLQRAGFRDELISAEKSESDWNQVAQLYMVFLQGNAMGTAFNVPSGDKLVRFFNNYKYTVYVPTNAALEAEIANGLPTWESIDDYLEANLQTVPEKPEEESGPDYEQYKTILAHNNDVKLKAQAMVTTLVNFLKYHFQDESIFVDNVNSSNHYMTAAIANDNYVNIDFVQTPGKIALTDATGRTVNVNPNKCNIFARETHFNNASTPRLIESSSYVVVHQLDGDKALHYKKVGKWSEDWASNKKAKAFLVNYGTQK